DQLPRCTRVQHWQAFCWTCKIVIISGVLRLMTAANICREISGARPSEGSSSSRSRGRPIKARAIASICCSPPESVPPRWCMRSLRRGNSANMRSTSAHAPARSEEHTSELQSLTNLVCRLLLEKKKKKQNKSRHKYRVIY